MWPITAQAQLAQPQVLQQAPIIKVKYCIEMGGCSRHGIFSVSTKCHYDMPIWVIYTEIAYISCASVKMTADILLQHTELQYVQKSYPTERRDN